MRLEPLDPIQVDEIRGALYSKGLDSEHVLVLEAQQLTGWDEARERRLLYIAMTRARTELCVSYYGESALMAHLVQSC